MTTILALAAKDLRLLFRNPGGLFFAFGWPIALAILFGFVFAGRKAEGIPVVVVDEDGSAASRAFVDRLAKAPELEILRSTAAEADDLVRRGRRVASIRLPAGFGAAGERMFHGEPQSIEIGIDPARTAEAGMLEGIVTRYAFEGFQKRLLDVDGSRESLRRSLATEADPESRSRLAGLEKWLGEFPVAQQTTDASTAAGGGDWQPVRVSSREIRGRSDGPKSSFEVSFPQGILWGILGCSAVFAVGLVRERSSGTLARLRTGPIGRTQILAGRAVATLAGLLLVEILLLSLGIGLFGIRPGSWILLGLAALASAIAFVGLSMGFSVLGRTEESASGIVWAANLVMAMLGGGAIPLMAMPEWMRAASVLSPARWVILSLEGAIWRGFGPAEMLLPLGILVGVGVVAFGWGALAFRD